MGVWRAGGGEGVSGHGIVERLRGCACVALLRAGWGGAGRVGLCGGLGQKCWIGVWLAELLLTTMEAVRVDRKSVV